MADGALAGLCRQASSASLPAATDMVMPAATARSTASLAAVLVEPPMLMLATAGLAAFSPLIPHPLAGSDRSHANDRPATEGSRWRATHVTGSVVRRGPDSGPAWYAEEEDQVVAGGTPDVQGPCWNRQCAAGPSKDPQRAVTAPIDQSCERVPPLADVVGVLRRAVVGSGTRAAVGGGIIRHVIATDSFRVRRGRRRSWRRTRSCTGKGRWRRR